MMYVFVYNMGVFYATHEILTLFVEIRHLSVYLYVQAQKIIDHKMKKERRAREKEIEAKKERM